jgi:hypothetical protein
MTNQTRRIAVCHLLLRGNRWTVLVAGMGPLTLQDSPSKRTYPHGSHVPQADLSRCSKAPFSFGRPAEPELAIQGPIEPGVL